MSFGGSHWCRSMPSIEHRQTKTDPHRSTSVSPHRSTKEVAACATVRILTHEEFAAKHPHPPKPFWIKKSDIDRQQDPAVDRHPDSADDQHNPPSIDRQPPLTYRVQLPKIDVARLNAFRNPSQPSEHMANNFEQLSDDALEPMQVDPTFESRTLRKRKEKVPKHIKRGFNEKEMDSFTKRVLRIPLDKPFEDPTGCGCKPRKLSWTYIGSSTKSKIKWSRGLHWRTRVIPGNLQCLAWLKALNFHVRCVTQVHPSAFYPRQWQTIWVWR